MVGVEEEVVNDLLQGLGTKSGKVSRGAGYPYGAEKSAQTAFRRVVKRFYMDLEKMANTADALCGKLPTLLDEIRVVTLETEDVAFWEAQLATIAFDLTQGRLFDPQPDFGLVDVKEISLEPIKTVDKEGRSKGFPSYYHTESNVCSQGHIFTPTARNKICRCGAYADSYH